MSKNPLLRAFFLLSLFLVVGPLLAGQDPLRRSVVKIFTAAQRPNYYEPWRVGTEEHVSGSGCILPGHLILTNAHVVSDQIFIQVLKDGDTQKYTAKEVAVAHDCDLAILKVEDADFFKGTKPVTFGDLPGRGDEVRVYGYPIGGDVLSTTKGVVSRIEAVPYSHSLRSLLGVQTDAAINPGNSGGPVFNVKKKKMVGVAFQGLNASVAQNTGFFIPALFVKRLLKEVKSGGYTGIPFLGIYAQTMENQAMRDLLGLTRRQTGLLVNKVVYGSSAWDQVKENDVLLSIDGYPIGNDGTIPFGKSERLNFQYPICLHHVGDKMKLKVFRGKKVLNLQVTLKKDTRLVPLPRYDRKPSYFIFAGVIFSELDTNYLTAFKDADSQLEALYFSGLPSPERKRVVMINHIIPHEITKGYGPDYANLIVTKVNGVPIAELKDVIKAVQKPVEGRHVIEIDRVKEVGTLIVLKAEGAAQATADILKQNNIPSDRSPDLREAKQ